MLSEHSYKLKQEEWSEFKKLLDIEYGARRGGNAIASSQNKERSPSIEKATLPKVVAAPASAAGIKIVGTEPEGRKLISGSGALREIKSVRSVASRFMWPYSERPL